MWDSRVSGRSAVFTLQSLGLGAPRCPRQRGAAFLCAACTNDVTFTDPAAQCSGIGEVSEAFRALAITKPQHVEQPVAVGMPDGSVHVHLHQRYSILASFNVRSVLVVRQAADGCICELEERWNGAPLLSFPAFRWVRRVNGMLSSLLTPLLVR